ncbi:hypothetical protein Q7P37_011025 [Cladosporium fusiforme]
MAHDTSISPPEDAHVASGITTEVPSPEKPSSMNIEDVDMLEIGPKATYISTGAAAALSQEHRDYLIQRHGTLELDPIPSMDPADPYNWPRWKSISNLILVAFHACMTTFSAAAIVPAYEDIALDLGVTLHETTYLTSIQIIVLGFGPLFWRPLSSRYGRRPIFIISLIGALAFNVGCALSGSYNTMVACRVVHAFSISPAGGIGSGVVTETFFKKERAFYIGIWTLMVTLGPPAAPFFMGFVSYQTGDYRWIYWVLVIITGVQLILYILLGPETRYIRQGAAASSNDQVSTFQREYVHFRRIDPSPLTLWEFVEPVSLFRHASIALPTIAYTIIFGFCSILLVVEIPIIFLPLFAFNPQQLGLQFLGLIIGSILGEQIGGRMSDWWMYLRFKRTGQPPRPEFRLWLSYGGYVLSIVGLVVFCVQTENATAGNWNVTPLVGAAIAAGGNQIVTTVCTTYAIDSHVEHSGSIGVFINLVRSTWGFIGPFYYPDMWVNLGGYGTAGLVSGIIVVASILPTLVQQFWIARRSGNEKS